MKKIIVLGSLTTTSLFFAATIVSCGPKDLKENKNKTGIANPTSKEVKKKQIRKKVIWHLNSVYEGKIVKGITFSPASFELPKSISVSKFLRRFQEFGIKKGKHGWWYKSKKRDSKTVLAINIGNLKIRASFDGEKIKVGGRGEGGPARHSNYILFDKDNNNKYKTAKEISKKLGVNPDSIGTNKTINIGNGGTNLAIHPKKINKINYIKNSSYYKNIGSLKGEALFTALHKVQNNHLGNIKKYRDLYSTYKKAFADTMYEKDGSLLDVYSESPLGKDPYNFKLDKDQRCGTYSGEGDCYNREHVIPQSRFHKKAPMHNDAQMAWPTDGKVNKMRGNYAHGIVMTAFEKSKNGGKLGVGTNGEEVFEPIDEFKGDFARAYFYFQLTYHGKASFSPFTSTFPYFDSTYLRTYIKWAKEDPIDAFDIQRNNEIAKIQGNRNPFCDYPNLVDSIWGANGTPFINRGIAPSIVA